MTGKDDVTVVLSRQQALVLWSFLNRCDDEGEYLFQHPAEQRAVWDLELLIQPQLPEVTSADYGDLLEEARAKLAGPDGQ